MVAIGLSYFGSSQGTRWLYPSRYAGPCIRCHQLVPAGTGQFRFDGARWVVRHTGGHCHTPGYVWYVSQGSETWQRVRSARLDFAGHRCEWFTIWSRRCKATDGLEIHHRHYQTLGSESLSDVIALCHPHHMVADQRRRTWGSWPLVGRPIWSRSGPIASQTELEQVSAAMANADASPPSTVPIARPPPLGVAGSQPPGHCVRCGWGVHPQAHFCSRCGQPVLSLPSQMMAESQTAPGGPAVGEPTRR
jgi:hypothetical protein